MKDYTTEEIKSLFIVKDDMQKSLNGIERYIAYMNKLDKVTPNTYFLMLKAQEELYKCILNKELIKSIEKSLKDCLGSWDIEDNVQAKCKMEEKQKKIEAIEMHKKELNRLLDCYLETHERPSETTIRNVYTVRDLFVEKWNEERNINNQ